MDVARHMTPDEFRRSGHAIIERIARYMEEVERYPVLSQAEPGSVRARLPVAAPEQGEPFADVLRDVEEIIVPGLTHWQSPNFYAFFPANASGPSILGDLLSSGFGVQGMLWATSPACTELETHVLDWLVDLLGLPERFRSSTAGGGVIQDSASSSTLTALLAARERASGGAVNEHGAGHGSPRQRLTVYTSRHAHSSIEKAVKIAGLGRDNLRLVEADGRHGIRVDALQAAIDGLGVALGRSALVEGDLAAGRLIAPFDISLPIEAAYYVVAPEQSADRPNIKAFREWLITTLATD